MNPMLKLQLRPYFWLLAKIRDYTFQIAWTGRWVYDRLKFSSEDGWLATSFYLGPLDITCWARDITNPYLEDN